MLRAAIAILLTILPAAALAQSAAPRPLATQGLETPGPRGWTLHLGADYGAGMLPTPLLGPGEEGDLLRFPALGFTWGIGRHAQIEVEWPGWQFFEGDEASDDEVGDAFLWTKVAFPRQGKRGPGLGFRFGFKVPVASTRTGLGTDEPDLFGTFLLEQGVLRGRILLNLGLGILGDPLRNGEQVDVIVYGLAFDAPAGTRVRLVGEAAGWYDGSSGGPSATRGEARLGVRLPAREGPGGFDAAVRVGYEKASPDWGLIVGYTWGRSGGPAPPSAARTISAM